MTPRASMHLKHISFFGLASMSMIFISCLINLAPASAACAAQDTSRGVSTNTFNIPASGSYRVWSRIMASSATNNSFILEIDGTTCGVIVGDNSAIPVGSWTWVNYKNGSASSPIDVSLSAGSHNLSMIGREDSVGLDRVIFTTDTSCIPSGTGDNCAVSSVTTSTGSGGSTTGGGSSSGTTTSNQNSTSSSTTNLSVKASDSPLTVNANTNLVVAPPVVPAGKTLLKVVYILDGKIYGTVSQSPFSLNLDTKNLPVGKHTLTTTSYYTDGTSSSVNQIITIKPVSKPISKTEKAVAATTTLAVLGAGTLLIGGRIKRSSLKNASSNANVDSQPGIITAPDQDSPASNRPENLTPGSVIAPTIKP